MFNVTPETHALVSLFIMVVAFLVAQIISHPGTAPAKTKTATAANPATNH